MILDSAEFITHRDLTVKLHLCTKGYSDPIYRSALQITTSHHDWESRDPGALVGWYEAHPSERPDIYLDDDGAFIAEDLFCVQQTCTCDEAVVAFAPAKIAGAQDVGSIRLRISTLDIVERRVEAKDAALLVLRKRPLHLDDGVHAHKANVRGLHEGPRVGSDPIKN
jgi:hypothetical protein